MRRAEEFAVAALRAVGLLFVLICMLAVLIALLPYSPFPNSLRPSVERVFWTGMCGAPFTMVALSIVWLMARDRPIDAIRGAFALRRARRQLGPAQPQAELHTLLVVIPANADPPGTTPALLKWLSMTLTAPAQVHYVRSPIAPDADRKALVGEALAAVMPHRASEEPSTAAYRESAASPTWAAPIHGVRLLGLCVATGATHTTSAPPTRLDDARALLHAIGPHTEGAACAVQLVPEPTDDALEPRRVGDLFPQLASSLA